MRRTRRRLGALLVWCVLVMVAWGLWLWRLDASDLTFDESATYYVAHRPPSEIISYLRRAVYEHPPVYYLLIHGWMRVAGFGEFSLRFFSVGAGVVAVALVGWVGRLTRTRAGVLRGLLPGLVLVAIPGVAYYARDARMYMLGVVWTLLSAGLFVRFFLLTPRWPRRGAVVGLVGVHLLALFTHYYLLLPILVQPLTLVLLRRWRPLLAWCGAHGLPVLAGLAWLNLAPGLQMSSRGLWYGVRLTVPPVSQVVHLLGKLVLSPSIGEHYQFLYPLLSLTVIGIALTLWERPAVGTWLSLAVTVSLLLAYAVPRSPSPRYVLFLAPFIALALGGTSSAMLRLRYRPLAYAAACGVALSVVWLLVRGGLYQALAAERSNYGRTLRFVQAHARPNDVLIFYGPWQWIPFQYYKPGDLPPIRVVPPAAPPLLDPDWAEPVLENLLSKFDRLWVLPAAVDDVDPAHFVDGWLGTHTHAVWDKADFSLHLPPLPSHAPARTVGVAFGEKLVLERMAWEPEPIAAGEPLRVTLTWSPLQPLQRDVRLGLTLVDSSGHVWQGANPVPGEWVRPASQWQPGDLVTDYEGLMVPAGAPPGDYTLRLTVGDAVTGELLPAEEGPGVQLLTVTVTEPAQTQESYALPDDGAETFCSPGGENCVTLLGHELAADRIHQGYPVPLTLHWLSPEKALPELDLHLQVAHRPCVPLFDPCPTPIVSRTLPLAPTYPASGWGPGRLVTLPVELAVPPDAPTGSARVLLEVLGPGGAAWRASDGTTSVSLSNVTIQRRPALRRLPRGLTRVQVDFGGEVELRGYRVEGEARPGGELSLTYAWYARAEPTAIYAVFNHLMTVDGARVAQADGWPQQGQMLTTQWQPGDYVEDHYTLRIPPDAPPGPYRLTTGLYRAMTGERLPATLNGERLPEDRVPIPLPGEGEG